MPDGPLTHDDSGKALPLTEVVDRHPMLVLRGDPGTGKTTSCKFLIHRAAQEFLEAVMSHTPTPPLPLFVELNRFQCHVDETADDALARLVAQASSGLWCIRCCL